MGTHDSTSPSSRRHSSHPTSSSLDAVSRKKRHRRTSNQSSVRRSTGRKIRKLLSALTIFLFLLPSLILLYLVVTKRSHRPVTEEKVAYIAQDGTEFAQSGMLDRILAARELTGINGSDSARNFTLTDLVSAKTEDVEDLLGERHLKEGAADHQWKDSLEEEIKQSIDPAIESALQEPSTLVPNTDESPQAPPSVDPPILPPPTSVDSNEAFKPPLLDPSPSPDPIEIPEPLETPEPSPPLPEVEISFNSVKVDDMSVSMARNGFGFIDFDPSSFLLPPGSPRAKVVNFPASKLSFGPLTIDGRKVTRLKRLPGGSQDRKTALWMGRTAIQGTEETSPGVKSQAKKAGSGSRSRSRSRSQSRKQGSGLSKKRSSGARSQMKRTSGAGNGQRQGSGSRLRVNPRVSGGKSRQGAKSQVKKNAGSSGRVNRGSGAAARGGSDGGFKAAEQEEDEGQDAGNDYGDDDEERGSLRRLLGAGIRDFQVNVSVTALDQFAALVTWQPVEVDGPDREFKLPISDPRAIVWLGGGVRSGPLNITGKRLVIHRSARRDPEVLESEKGDTFGSVPFVLTTAGYGIFVESLSNGVISLRNPKKIVLRFRDSALRLVFIQGPLLTQVLTRFSAMAARKGPKSSPPLWAFSPIIGRLADNSHRQIPVDAALLRENAVPASLALVDWPVTTTCNTFLFSKSGSASLKRRLSEMESLGFATIVGLSPCVTTAAVDRLTAGRISVLDAQLTSGEKLVNFSKPEAARWLAEELTELQSKVDNGIRGFKVNGIKDIHHRKPIQFLLKNEVGFMEAMESTQDKATVLFSTNPAQFRRRSFLLSTVLVKKSETPIETAVSGAQQAAMAGHSLWGPNFNITKYFKENRPSSLHQLKLKTALRWVQFSALMPIMYTTLEGQTRLLLSQIWSAQIVQRFARIHFSLAPYFLQSSRADRPIVCPLLVCFSWDTDAAKFEDQYSLGDSLLVGPIPPTEGDDRFVVAYLPRGFDWVDFWSGEMHKGGQSMRLRTFIDEIPIFVKSGSIFELIPDDVNSLWTPGNLQVDSSVMPVRRKRVIQIWPSDSNMVTFLSKLQIKLTVTLNSKEPVDDYKEAKAALKEEQKKDSEYQKSEKLENEEGRTGGDELDMFNGLHKSRSGIVDIPDTDGEDVEMMDDDTVEKDELIDSDVEDKVEEVDEGPGDAVEGSGGEEEIGKEENGSEEVGDESGDAVEDSVGLISDREESMDGGDSSTHFVEQDEAGNEESDEQGEDSGGSGGYKDGRAENTGSEEGLEDGSEDGDDSGGDSDGQVAGNGSMDTDDDSADSSDDRRAMGDDSGEAGDREDSSDSDSDSLQEDESAAGSGGESNEAADDSIESDEGSNDSATDQDDTGSISDQGAGADEETGSDDEMDEAVGDEWSGRSHGNGRSLLSDTGLLTRDLSVLQLSSNREAEVEIMLMFRKVPHLKTVISGKRMPNSPCNSVVSFGRAASVCKVRLGVGRMTLSWLTPHIVIT